MRLSKLGEPEEIIRIVNGELIRRLEGPGGRGSSKQRRLQPMDFRQAIVVLDSEDTTTEFLWNDELREKYKLNYNFVGMLGERSAEYDQETVPLNPEITLEAIPAPVQSQEALRNLKRWNEELNVFVDERYKASE